MGSMMEHWDRLNTGWQPMNDMERWWCDAVDSGEVGRIYAELLLSVREDVDTGCWELEGERKHPAKVWLKGKLVRAYQIACIHHERIPLNRDCVVRHMCNNRRCINPKHLISGSHAENYQDRIST